MDDPAFNRAPVDKTKWRIIRTVTTSWLSICHLSNTWLKNTQAMKTSIPAGTADGRLHVVVASQAEQLSITLLTLWSQSFAKRKNHTTLIKYRIAVCCMYVQQTASPDTLERWQGIINTSIHIQSYANVIECTFPIVDVVLEHRGPKTTCCIGNMWIQLFIHKCPINNGPILCPEEQYPMSCIATRCQECVWVSSLPALVTVEMFGMDHLELVDNVLPVDR